MKKLHKTATPSEKKAELASHQSMKSLKETINMGRPLTPPAQTLEEMLHMDEWRNIPPVIVTAFKSVALYTQGLRNHLELVSNKVLVLNRDAEMGNLNIKTMISAACVDVAAKAAKDLRAHVEG
jgi:hypothetical protein